MSISIPIRISITQPVIKYKHRFINFYRRHIVIVVLVLVVLVILTY